MGTITLEPANEMLNDVVVTQSLARTRQTPVAVSQVNRAEIDTKLGSQELPEILNTTPGVWATKDGGGFGDAKINMRGFKSENLAVMVNGIPVNDMEGGWVYWSNWAGLGDVASNIQTQRGLGAAVLSAPSVGGTINITTQSLDAEKGGRVWYGFGNDGPVVVEVGADCVEVYDELAEALECRLDGDEGVGEWHTEVADYGRVGEVALQTRDRQLGR